eukprot:1151055-Pelagomonas_calceolata.AAC.1
MRPIGGLCEEWRAFCWGTGLQGCIMIRDHGFLRDCKVTIWLTDCETRNDPLVKLWPFLPRKG